MIFITVRASVFNNEVDKRVFKKIIIFIISIEIDADVSDNKVDKYLCILLIIKEDVSKKDNKY